MYQIAYVLSIKIYYSENFSSPKHYNTDTKASELQLKRNLEPTQFGSWPVGQSPRTLGRTYTLESGCGCGVL